MSTGKIEVENCFSCNKNLSPDKTGSVSFHCPNCGATIVRCTDCRRLSNKYVCPGCEFEGP